MKYPILVFFVAVLTAACGSSSPVTSPGSSLTTLTGTWSGSSADSTGRESMTWNVTQNGASVTGTMNMSDTARSMMGTGTMTGTVNGSTVTFHMGVPNGGFSGMMSSCSMMMDGQATMSADGHTLTGTYSGNMSGMMFGSMMNQACGGAMSNGAFTLTR